MDLGRKIAKKYLNDLEDIIYESEEKNERIIDGIEYIMVGCDYNDFKLRKIKNYIITF